MCIFIGIVGKRMKKNILNFFKDKNNYPLIFLIISISLIYSVAKLGYIDDHGYLTTMGDMSYFEFIIYNFNTWSSRVLGAALHLLIAPYHWLWFILNVSIWVLTYYSIDKIVNTNKSVYVRWFIVLLILSYRHNYMASAGWIATTLNYSWPLAFAIYSVIPFLKMVRNEEIKIWEWFLYFSSLLFASNFEQLTLILGGLYFIFWIYSILKKYNHWPYLFGLSLISLNVLLILISPGNFVRRVAEVDRWFPEYSSLSLFRIVDLGFSSSLYPVIFQPDIIYILFGLVLALNIFLKKSNFISKIISQIPITFMFVFGLLNETLNNIFPSIDYVNNSLTTIGTGMSISSPMSFIPNILLGISILSIIYSIYIGFDKSELSYLLIILFGLGLFSRFAMALSPTIWASVERTFIFMQFSFVIIAVIVFNNIVNKYFNSKIENYFIYW